MHELSFLHPGRVRRRRGSASPPIAQPLAAPNSSTQPGPADPQGSCRQLPRSVPRSRGRRVPRGCLRAPRPVSPGLANLPRASDPSAHGASLSLVRIPLRCMGHVAGHVTSVAAVPATGIQANDPRTLARCEASTGHGRERLSSSDLLDGPDSLRQDSRRRGDGAPAGCRDHRHGFDDDLPPDGHRDRQADDGRARRGCDTTLVDVIEPWESASVADYLRWARPGPSRTVEGRAPVHPSSAALRCISRRHRYADSFAGPGSGPRVAHERLEQEAKAWGRPCGRTPGWPPTRPDHPRAPAASQQTAGGSSGPWVITMTGRPLNELQVEHHQPAAGEVPSSPRRQPSPRCDQATNGSTTAMLAFFRRGPEWTR